MTTNAEAVAETPERAERIDAGKPIVLKLKKRKKKKKKRYSSRTLGDIQRTEERLSRISDRMAKSVSEGTKEYRRARRRSSKKRKDGAIIDFVPNMGEALSASLSEASELPIDLAEAVNTRTTRRQLRRQLRASSNVLRAFRL